MKKIMLLFMAVAVFLGCKTPNKSVRLLHRAERNSPVTVAQYCSEKFPPVASSKEKTDYTQGVPTVTQTSVKANIDSLWDAWLTQYGHDSGIDTASFIAYLKSTDMPCPPCSSRVDTFKSYQHIVTVDRAGIAMLEEQKEVCRDALARLETKYATLMYVCIVLGAYTLLRWILKIWGIKLP